MFATLEGMSKFTLSQPELKAFETDHAEALTRDLMRHDKTRQAILIAIVVGITALAPILSYWWMISEGVRLNLTSFDFQLSAGVCLLVYGSSLFGSVYGYASYIRRSTKRRVYPILAKSLGWQFDENAAFPTPLRQFTRYGLLTEDYDYVRPENFLLGKIDDVAFMGFDLHLLRKGNKNSKNTVFRGHLFMLQFPHKFAAKTIVLQDRGWLNKRKLKVSRAKKPSFVFSSAADMKAAFEAYEETKDTPQKPAQKLDRVRIVDPVFEKKFEAFGSDQVEARVILTPEFIEKCVELERALYGQNMRFGFVGNKLLIVIEEPRLKSLPSLYSSLSAQRLIQCVLNEAGSILYMAKIMRTKKNSFERASVKRESRRAVA